MPFKVEFMCCTNQYKYFLPLSYSNLVLLFLITTLLLSGLFLLNTLLKLWMKDNTQMFRTIKLVTIPLLILFILLISTFIYINFESKSSIILEEKDILISPYIGSDNSFTINPGSKVKISEEFNDFLFITDQENRYGWIESKSVGYIWK